MRVTCRHVGKRGPRGGARIAVLAVGIGLVVAASAGATTIYVDNRSGSCSFLGPGTEASPYCTISGALAARGGPGVTIVVKPGVYREQITIPVSGAAGLPLVVRAEGPGVVVDGADDFGNPGRWTFEDVVMVGGSRTPSTDTPWLARDVTWNPSQVFVDGARLSRAPAIPDRLPVNSFTWVSGEGLYVNLGGVNPGRRGIRVGRRNHGFNLFSKSWVVIEGFDITGTEDRAVNVQTGCADLVIARNRVTFANGYGIQAVNALRLRIEQNIVSDCAFHGIGLISGSSGCLVRNNESFRNSDPAVRRACGIYLFGAPGNTLAGNILRENQDSGVQISGGSNDCVLYNNRSWMNGDNGYDHGNSSGTIHVNNVAHGNQSDGFSIESGSPGTRIHNCVSVDNGLAARRYNLWVSLSSAPSLVSDHNIFWNSTVQEPIRVHTTKFATLSSYQNAMGQDANSIQANPLFVGPAVGNFMLAAGSPAIDAGTSGVSFWPATDAAGNPRWDDPATPNRGAGPVSYSDIGALEFRPPGASGAALLVPPVVMQEPSGAGAGGLRTTGSQGPDAAAISFSGGFPNPARAAIEFSVELVDGAKIEWAVFDLQGRMVWSEDRVLGAGRTLLRWDGLTQGGEPAGSGVYLVRARIAGSEITRRVIRL